LIDFRSDTVTKPSKQMLDAMMNAVVGDDVFNEDPTVKELQDHTAKLFGMEAGLFCPSGTMCNQIAIKAHTQPLDEIICDGYSHIYNYENGMWAMASGVSLRLINTDDGIINAQQVEAQIQPDHDWLPETSMVVIENTCNRAGGTVYPLKTMQALSESCKANKLKFHLDGARVFNALATGKYEAKDLHGLFDSISICLSKGLGAPIGSVLIGSNAFIKKARKLRKAFGGGMRQVGLIAAAGLYAIKNNANRVVIDNENALKLGAALTQSNSVEYVRPIETNIVIYKIKDSLDDADYIEQLKQKGIIAISFGGNMVRLVTHLNIDDAMMEKAMDVLKIV